VLEQELEQRELAGGESHLPAGPRHAVGRRVEGEVGAGEHRARPARHPPEDGADPREELLEVERLHEVVVGARVESGDPVLDRVARRQHDDRRHDAPRSPAAQDVDARLAREHPVEQHDLDPALGEGALRAGRGGERADAVTLLRESPLEERSDATLVLDDEDGHADGNSPGGSGRAVRALARS
jgi:hypothetical protein